MPVINLSELKHFSRAIIAEYVLSIEENDFHIHLNKKHSEGNDNQKGVFWNYTIAAWTGKLLHPCCKQFSFTAPEAGDQAIPFIYSLHEADMTKLPQILWQISTGLFGNKKEVLKFHALASYHFELVCYSKHFSPVMPLIGVANKFLEQQL